jgi:hypothetical protein
MADLRLKSCVRIKKYRAYKGEVGKLRQMFSNVSLTQSRRTRSG